MLLAMVWKVTSPHWGADCLVFKQVHSSGCDLGPSCDHQDCLLPGVRKLEVLTLLGVDDHLSGVAFNQQLMFTPWSDGWLHRSCFNHREHPEGDAALSPVCRGQPSPDSPFKGWLRSAEII